MRSRQNVFTALLLAFLTAAIACSGDDLAAPTTGTLEVTTETSGTELDVDGYAVQVDSGPAVPMGAAATLRNTGLNSGTHTLRLVGLAPNCVVDGENPVSVDIVAGQTARAHFQVACSPLTGTLHINIATTGEFPDTDGYVLDLDGTARGSLGAVATLQLDRLRLGTHVVGLSGVAINCQVQGENPRTVEVSAAPADVSFALVCTNTGGIRVSVTTSGPTPDPDGYVVELIVKKLSHAVAPIDTVTFSNLSYGYYQISFTGVARNCSLAGEDRREIQVIAGVLADVLFAVTCIEPPANPGWTLMASGTTASLIDVHGTSPTNVFAVGINSASDTRVLHYDGTSWSSQEAPGCCLRRVWASSATEAFAVGSNGGFYTLGTFTHFDGQRWTSMTPPTPNPAPDEDGLGIWGLWGSSPTDVFAVGYINVTTGLWTAYVAHYDGAAWSQMPLPRGEYLRLGDVWGTSASNVYATGEYHVWDDDEAVGDRGVILHYDGHQWSEVLREPFLHLKAIWGSSANDIYATGLNYVRDDPRAQPYDPVIWHYDGVRWSVLPPTPQPCCRGETWGSSATDVYVLAGGGIIHYDGQAWSETLSEPIIGLSGIWVSSTGDAFAVGEAGTIWHRAP